MAAPITFIWLKGAMHPLRRFAKAAGERFLEGEVYMLDEAKGRSRISHDHEFAWLHEAWLNLPESLADQYPTADHLRKRALIEGGFYDERIVDCGTNAAALRVAAYARSKDEFAVVVVRGPLMVERIAKSQSLRAMGKADFQASKTKVMEVVSELIGVTFHEPEQVSPSQKPAGGAFQGNAGRREVAVHE